MRSRSAVPSFRPAVESLESRDLPSALTNTLLRLLPLAPQIAANSNAALARLTAADNIRTSILTAASHPTNNSAAATFGQGAAALQEVLTERRVLDVTFLMELNLFATFLPTETRAARKLDTQLFLQFFLPQLNNARNQAIAN